MVPDCYGRGAPDIELRVPVGTIVSDFETGEVIADSRIKKHGRRSPGRQRRSRNLHFKSSVNRAPREFTHGRERRPPAS